MAVPFGFSQHSSSKACISQTDPGPHKPYPAKPHADAVPVPHPTPESTALTLIQQVSGTEHSLPTAWLGATPGQRLSSEKQLPHSSGRKPITAAADPGAMQPSSPLLLAALAILGAASLVGAQPVVEGGCPAGLQGECK